MCLREDGARSDSSKARPRPPFAQLTRTWRIRHDTSGVRATWEFNADQIQNGSLCGSCERINSSSRLDSRPAALLTLLIPSPPLWNSLDCRGLVPPKSGVLTLCLRVCVCARPPRGNRCAHLISVDLWPPCSLGEARSGSTHPAPAYLEFPSLRRVHLSPLRPPKAFLKVSFWPRVSLIHQLADCLTFLTV